MKEFGDKVAVITGAGSGIGRGLAECCAREGMKVVLAGINESTLEPVEKNIKATAAATMIVKTDVSKAGDVEALAKKTLDAFGAVHLLCNNAGVGTGGSVWECTPADWEWVMGVNLWGVIHGIRYFVPAMIEQGTECHIVNVASSAGLFFSMYNGPYAVSKHGVVVLSATLYHELALKAKNIGVSVVCPGFIKTNVYDSERNRPAALRNDAALERQKLEDPVIKAMGQYMRQMVENGMTVQECADIIFNAIKENKFYVLPNAASYKSLIQTQTEDILQERNPQPLYTG